MSHLVITIGCEYGAKGNQIGRKIAEDLQLFMKLESPEKSWKRSKKA